MIWSDTDIKHAVKSGYLKIEPFDEAQVEPASYDVLLDDRILSAGVLSDESIDVSNPPAKLMREDDLMLDFNGVIPPGEFWLASTKETFALPDFCAARVEGKSTLGRLGLQVHATAGYIDPGFEGQITLELSNVGPWPLRLRPGMRIAQISFHSLKSVPENIYRGKYVGQKGPTAARPVGVEYLEAKANREGD